MVGLKRLLRSSAVKPPPSARRRLVESSLWVAAAAVGVFVLLPAFAELIDARRMENQARLRADQAGQQMLEDHNSLKYIVDDSESVRKLAEQKGLIERNHRPQGDASPPSPR
jgi:hypothetical protein